MLKDFNLDNDGVRRGAWTEEEDDKLRSYIQRYGHWSWELLPKFAGLSRSGKSCRLRWLNYLRPDIKHGNFTIDEDNTIVELHNKLGNKWTAIAANLPGRSDNEIKNRWNSHLKKRATGKKIALETPKVETIESNKVNPTGNLGLGFYKEGETVLDGVSSQLPSCSSFNEFSPCWFSGSDNTFSNDVGPHTSSYELVQDFWTEQPFLQDISSSVDNMITPMNGVDDFVFRSSCQDMPMNDEFSWSTLDSYFEYNREYIN